MNQQTPSRRNVIRAAAWAAPVVTVTSAAPAFASSPGGGAAVPRTSTSLTPADGSTSPTRLIALGESPLYLSAKFSHPVSMTAGAQDSFTLDQIVVNNNANNQGTGAWVAQTMTGLPKQTDYTIDFYCTYTLQTTWTVGGQTSTSTVTATAVVAGYLSNINMTLNPTTAFNVQAPAGGSGVMSGVTTVTFHVVARKKPTAEAPVGAQVGNEYTASGTFALPAQIVVA